MRLRKTTPAQVFNGIPLEAIVTEVVAVFTLAVSATDRSAKSATASTL